MLWCRNICFAPAHWWHFVWQFMLCSFPSTRIRSIKITLNSWQHHSSHFAGFLLVFLLCCAIISYYWLYRLSCLNLFSYIMQMLGTHASTTVVHLISNNSACNTALVLYFERVVCPMTATKQHSIVPEHSIGIPT